jgi:flavorubredoxin
MPTKRLRWIAFGHFEADECGAMNEWLAIAPQATPAQGKIGCMVSLNDFADRLPRVLTDGEVVNLGGGKRVRFIDTPQTPHGWDAGVLYEESTRTLMCGDLFTQLGNDRTLTDGDIVGPAIAAEDMFKYSSLNPGMGATIRSLSNLAPHTLALMHGPSFTGDGAAALRALADDYDRRVFRSGVRGSSERGRLSHSVSLGLAGIVSRQCPLLALSRPPDRRCEFLLSGE